MIGIKRFFLNILAACVLLSGMAAPVQAAAGASSSLVATYSVASQSPATNGTAVVLDVVLHNPSDTAIASLSLTLADPVLTSGSGALTVSQVPARGDATATWALVVSGPGLLPGQALLLHATGSDANGQAFDFDLTGVAR